MSLIEGWWKFTFFPLYGVQYYSVCMHVSLAYVVVAH